MNTKKSKARSFLERLARENLTIGNLIRSIRLGEELTQKNFSEQLGISVQHLCNIEKGLKNVSPERAVQFARKLGYSEKQFLRLALQEQLNKQGVPYQVEIRAA